MAHRTVKFFAWRWGLIFSAVHINVLREALRRHVHVDHELVVCTDDPSDICDDVRVLPMPMRFSQTPRCRRRMQGFSREFSEAVAGIDGRVCYIDLDVVIVDDITALVTRPEPIVGWRVGHAGVYSGSFLLADAGALDGAWQKFAADPEGYPASLQRKGIASDQAMLNDWLKTQPPIGELTEKDGLVTYYGRGYERLEHLGVGPNRRKLPMGARMVVLGSADLDVLEDDRFSWVKKHWQALRTAVPA